MENNDFIMDVDESPCFKSVLASLMSSEKLESSDSLEKPESFGSWFEADHDFD